MKVPALFGLNIIVTTAKKKLLTQVTGSKLQFNETFKLSKQHKVYECIFKKDGIG